MTRTPLSRSKGHRSRSPGRFTHCGVKASGSCSCERGNVSAPTEGGEPKEVWSLFKCNWL